MSDLTSKEELLKAGVLPAQFELNGDMFRIGGSSASSMADMSGGTLGFVSFRNVSNPSDMGITVWYGLMNDLSIKPFCVLSGDGAESRHEAVKRYEMLQSWGLAPD